MNPLPIQPSFPPTPFADGDNNKVEPSIYWGEEEQESMVPESQVDDDLEAFLATVAVAPPDHAHKITTEEILSYIIPPPPKTAAPSTSSFSTISLDNNTKNVSLKKKKKIVCFDDK